MPVSIFIYTARFYLPHLACLYTLTSSMIFRKVKGVKRRYCTPPHFLFFHLCSFRSVANYITLSFFCSLTWITSLLLSLLHNCYPLPPLLSILLVIAQQLQQLLSLLLQLERLLLQRRACLPLLVSDAPLPRPLLLPRLLRPFLHFKMF